MSAAAARHRCMWPDCDLPRAAPLPESPRARPLFCQAHAIRGHAGRRAAAGLAAATIGADLVDPSAWHDPPKLLRAAQKATARKAAARLRDRSPMWPPAEPAAAYLAAE
jgi:hypothetical protein